jgi:hypothetical protein
MQLDGPRTANGWTLGRGFRYGQAMRRSRFDPLEPTKEPRWYTVRNMYGKLLEVRLLPPVSDLKARLRRGHA